MVSLSSRRLFQVLIPFVFCVGLGRACEKDCMNGITRALIGNYSVPVHLVVSEMTDAIVREFVPEKQYPTPATAYLKPIVAAFNNGIHDALVFAIFKSFFHGKCQNPETGINPPGCPNPDCPVVCGTPGSIVHYYSHFRYLAFNGTAGLMTELSRTSSPAFQDVEEAIRKDVAAQHARRRGLWLTRAPMALRMLYDDYGVSDRREIARRADDIRKRLQVILHTFRHRLLLICGGDESGQTNRLPDCSWEQDMKAFILSYP